MNALLCRREFFQCDFDVAGTYATMVADSEVIKVLVEILQVGTALHLITQSLASAICLVAAVLSTFAR